MGSKFRLKIRTSRNENINGEMKNTGILKTKITLKEQKEV